MEAGTASSTNAAAAKEARARRTEWWVPVLLLLAAFTLYLFIALRFVDPFTTSVHEGPLGTNPLTSARSFFQLRYEWKHPLMSPVGVLATGPFRLLPMLDRLEALACGVAALAALNVLLAYYVVRQVFDDPVIAGLAAAGFGLTFTNLCVFSVPDSYAATSLSILLFFYAWLRTAHIEPSTAAVRLGLLAGIAALCNVPLLLLAGLPPLRALWEGSMRRAIVAGLKIFIIALGVFAGTVCVYSMLKYGNLVGYFEQATIYVNFYADIDRLRRGANILDVFTSFYLFSIAPPVSALPFRLTSAATIGYLDGPMAILGFAGVALLLGYVIVGLFGRYWRITVPLVVWTGALSVFYTFFFPIAAMLYSAQVQAALVLMASFGIATIARSGKVARTMLAALALLLLVRNVPLLLFGPYGFELRYDQSGIESKEAVAGFGATGSSGAAR